MLTINIQPNVIKLNQTTEILLLFENKGENPYINLFFALYVPKEIIILSGDKPVQIELLRKNTNYIHRLQIIAEKLGSFTLKSRKLIYYNDQGQLIQSKWTTSLSVENSSNDMGIVKKTQSIRPTEHTKPVENEQIYFNNLYKKIEKSFNTDELKQLCFLSDIDFDNLPKNPKSSLIIELIQYCDRHGKIGSLVQKCRELRPNIDW